MKLIYYQHGIEKIDTKRFIGTWDLFIIYWNCKTWFQQHNHPWIGKPLIVQSMDGHTIQTDNPWIELRCQASIWIQG